MSRLRYSLSVGFGSIFAALAFVVAENSTGMAQTPTPGPQSFGTATGTARSKSTTFGQILQPSSPTPSPTPAPTPSPTPTSTPAPAPIGILPYATINLTPPGGPIGQVSTTTLIPDDNGNLIPTTVYFTPNLTPKKVTSSGNILLLYDRGSIPMPMGYAWMAGAFIGINHSPSWLTSNEQPPNNQSTWGDVSVSDMNDSGIVVGNGGVQYPPPTSNVLDSLLSPLNPNSGEYGGPIYWKPTTGMLNMDATMFALDALVSKLVINPIVAGSSQPPPNGTPDTQTIAASASSMARLIDDSGAIYGTNLGPTAWTSGAVLGQNLDGSVGWIYGWNPSGPGWFQGQFNGGGVKWSSYGDTNPSYYNIANSSPAPFVVSSGGKHFLQIDAALGSGPPGEFLYLDGMLIPFTLGSSSSIIVGVNESGRYIIGANAFYSGSSRGPLYADGLSAPEAISPQLSSGTVMAINNNSDILATTGGGAYFLYTWQPPVAASGNQPATPGSYTQNSVTIAPPLGWTVGSIVPSMSDSRVLVGTISNQSTNAPAAFVPCALLVDANRDGVIDNNDVGASSVMTPFRFWINDGVDGNSPLSNRSPGSLTTSGDTVQADLAPGTAPGPNYQQGYITCTRDLENFARLWLSIGGLSQAISSGGITVGLEWHSNTGDAVNGWGPNDGAPAINIYLAAPNHGDPTQKGTSAYLTDPATASDQSSLLLYQYTLGQVAKGAPLYLPASSLTALTATNPNAYFLFEGAARGTGRLVITFNTGTPGNYTKIGESGGLYMDLKDIKELYERWTVGDGSTGVLEGGGGAPLAIAGISQDRLPAGVQSGLTYSSTTTGLSVPTDTNGNKYILFVHGWNLAPWEKDTFAETALKRLYWQGYKGKFGTFQWPTTYYVTGASLGLPVTCYDDGEFTAWQSAAPLEQLLVALHGGYGSNVYVLAHSMGNVVTGEALRLAGQNGVQLLVNTYVGTQAAVPGACYDPLLDAENPLPTTWGSIKTPNIYDGWLASSSAAVGTRAAFCNVNDFALTLLWEPDQETKPDSGYSYAGTDFSQIQDLFETGLANGLHLGNSANVQDRYQIMAYAAQPRSLALGAVLDVSPSAFGPTQSLPPFGTQAGVWPTDTFNEPNGLYSSHVWHSAEFLFTNADQQNYWHALLGPNGFDLLP